MFEVFYNQDVHLIAFACHSVPVSQVTFDWSTLEKPVLDSILRRLFSQLDRDGNGEVSWNIRVRSWQEDSCGCLKWICEPGSVARSAWRNSRRFSRVLWAGLSSSRFVQGRQHQCEMSTVIVSSQIFFIRFLTISDFSGSMQITMGT